MSCNGTANCACGCCAGTSVETPQPRGSAPGLSAVSYRAGTWASFKESMLARLSSSDYPALAALKTRDDDDFTIALLDASAMVLDILTFYQERLANESYLRTAVQLRSLSELSRLIGYRPAPGASASTYAAFSLRSAPGQAPNPANPAITIPQGTQIQSVPAQGQTPQTFETFSDIPAKADWSALPVQTAQPWTPLGGSIYLSGTATQLQLGDSLLFLGAGRESWTPRASQSPPPGWDVVVINRIQTDTLRNLTLVSWDHPLTHADNLSSSYGSAVKVFALRQKASLFGHNAPNPNLFVNTAASGTPASTSLPNLITNWQWNGFEIPSASQIDLDAAYPKVVAGSWFALTSFGVAQIYRAVSAKAVSVSNFALSGKVTELAADYQDPLLTPHGPTAPPAGTPAGEFGGFTLPLTEVWAQSEQLSVAQQPLTYPLFGTLLDLQDLRPDLAGVQVVALSGKRQKIAVANGVTGLAFITVGGGSVLWLNPGDVLTLTDPTPLSSFSSGQSFTDWSTSRLYATLNVEDAGGRAGSVSACLNQFILAPSGAADPIVSEYALVSAVLALTEPYAHTQLQLASALANCYDRTATTVNANVVLATCGQSVSEVMGNGNASTPNQSFTLKQSPLTYVQAPTQSGTQSTLQVQVNGAAWSEVPSLYGEGPSQPVFATLNQSDGTTDVLFGDGIEGALLPTGQNNIVANYRIGLGSAGNIAANTLTTLVDRPLGVSGVTNPLAATGGQDAQTVDGIRSSAPLSVLTLGRAVSLADYQNYASTFAGLAKAYAVWIPSGPAQGVFLTVAGVGGSALLPENPTIGNLVAALRNYGNPLIPITVQSFLETQFAFSADLKYDPAYSQPAVQAQVLQTLSQAYSFSARTFGQGVSGDELAAAIQAVPGVVGVNIKEIHTVATSAGGDLGAGNGYFIVSRLQRWEAAIFKARLLRPYSGSPTQLNAYLPVASSTSVPQPAEILVLDPNPNSIALGVMP